MGSDWRDLNVTAHTESGISDTVLGLIVRLAAIVRGRQWAPYDCMQGSERILVNTVGMDEKRRGGRFWQTRRHEYPAEWRFQKGKWRKSASGAMRPMRITIEQ